jgi:hypothetical protein
VDVVMLGDPRDVTSPEEPKLAFSAQWGAFLARVKDHKFGMS